MERERWVVAAKRADFGGISERFKIDQVIARLIRNRDVIGDEAISKYLYGGMEELYSPWLLKGMQACVDLLKEKIGRGVHIRIIGDYDIDGVMSTYILQCGLSSVGAKVDIMIPHRIHDGYGINIELVEQAYQDGVDTILTCDNGIAAKEQIARAKELGMTVIVTDHHEVPYEDNDGEITYILPDADVIVNPKQVDCEYPFKDICGAVVAFKVISAVFQTFGVDKSKSEALLEFAAFATIGDVMDLVDENRIIVREGLKKMRHTSNLGLQELIRENGLNPEEIEPYHIGFVLGPCMNASGRLDTAKRSFELLNAKTREEAAKAAGDLKSLNDSRKEMTNIGIEAAFKRIEESEYRDDKVLVVYLEDCHESLAGIIAGRIRERYNKPAFVLTRAEGVVKGSGRSIEAFHMYDEMVKCKDLFLKFGGHPMAAGLSIKEEDVDEFRRRLNENTTLTEEDFVRKVTIDIPMPVSYVSEKLIEEMTVLEPFGKGNEKPLFAQRNLRVLGSRILGKNRNVMKLQLQSETGTVVEGICFHHASELEILLNEKEQISITYYPKINEYMGKKTIQFVIQNYC